MDEDLTREPVLDRNKYRNSARELVREVLLLGESDAVELAFAYLLAADGQGREHEARCWQSSLGRLAAAKGGRKRVDVVEWVEPAGDGVWRARRCIECGATSAFAPNAGIPHAPECKTRTP